MINTGEHQVTRGRPQIVVGSVGWPDITVASPQILLNSKLVHPISIITFTLNSDLPLDKLNHNKFRYS